MPDQPELEPVQQTLRMSFGTKAVCTRCGREDAPFLYLKRSHSRYDLLCVQLNGSGCYPQSSRTLCRHVDQDQAQCFQQAEWRIAFGRDHSRVTESCSDHLGRMLGDGPIHEVFPLDD